MTFWNFTFITSQISKCILIVLFSPFKILIAYLCINFIISWLTIHLLHRRFLVIARSNFLEERMIFSCFIFPSYLEIWWLISFCRNLGNIEYMFRSTRYKTDIIERAKLTLSIIIMESNRWRTYSEDKNQQDFSQHVYDE